MVHGNVRISSIFTNKAGEWKLGGFELLDSMKEESPMIMVSWIGIIAYKLRYTIISWLINMYYIVHQTFGGVLPDANRYMSPEINKSGWSIVRE
jgi:SCY1-like protein 1